MTQKTQGSGHGYVPPSFSSLLATLDANVDCYSELIGQKVLCLACRRNGSSEQHPRRIIT